jgi:general secretion pathway protein D
VQYAGVELPRVIRDIGLATGTRFIFGDDVRGVVTITVPKPVSQQEALELLRAALFVKGFAQLPAGDDAFKIVPIAETSSGSEFVQRRLDRTSERSITTLYTLRYTDANVVAETIKTLAPSSGSVVAYAPTNSLMLSGTESALGRLLEIVRVIDDASSEDLMARVIRYRAVDEIVEMADEALNAGWTPASQIEFFSDARTNMLLARASPERLAELRDFIETFDRFEAGRGRINVVRVLNREPDEIVDLLRSLQSGVDVVEAGPEGSTDAVAIDVAGDSLAGQDFQLTVDAPTRSIIVQAEPSVGRLVADVIAELDRIPPRVAVEVFFYEVERPSGYLIAFDFSTLIGAQSQDKLAFAVSNKPSGSRVPTGPVGDPVTGGSGVFGRLASDPVIIDITDPNTGITIPITIPTNEVAVEASAGSIRMDLLSRPNLLVTSGDEHELFIGNNIPIPVTAGNPGVATDGTADGTTFINPLVQQQNIERVDVGTTLRVRPTVGVEGDVKLGITLEFSEVTRSKAGDPRQVGVTLLQRTIESTATVRPGEYLILGMQDERSSRYSKTGVPWLMNLPGIGLLFSRTEEQLVDTQILMAVKARLMRSAADEVAETIRRRIAFERSLSRVADLKGLDQTPWAVRLATYEYRADAREVADTFEADGFVTRVTHWEGASRPYWDVYLVGYPSFEEASVVAAQAIAAEWEGEVMLLPAPNEMAPPS